MLSVLIKTFSFAIKGIYYGLKTQKNLRVQLGVFILVIIAAVLSGFTLKEYLVIMICSALVFTAELLNTAIEVLVDMVSPEWNDKAGMVKDIAAGAVLVCAVISGVIGVLLFANHYGFI